MVEDATPGAAAREHRRVFSAASDVLAFLLVCAAYIVRALANCLVPARYRPHKSLAGDVVLITGGGGGLGRLLALRLARLQATVVLWDINMDGEYKRTVPDRRSSFHLTAVKVAVDMKVLLLFMMVMSFCEYVNNLERSYVCVRRPPNVVC